MRVAPAFAVLGAAFVLAGGALAAPAPVSKELQEQWTLAGGPAVRIMVHTTGWYRVPRSKLVAAGLSPSVPARTLRLFVDGREVPILVKGIVDGHLGPQGLIQFYGVRRDSPSTDTRVYWLVWGGQDGLRIQAVTQGFKGPRAVSFPSKTTMRKPTKYFSINTDETGLADSFFSAVARPATPAQLPLNVPAPAPRAGRALLEVRVQGYGDLPHRVRIGFNGTPLAIKDFNLYGSAVVSAPVDRKLIKPGTNTVTVETLHGELDFVLVDFVRLTYGRLYRAEDNRLTFRLADRRRALVTGFTKRALRLIDITTPSEPKVVAVSTRRSGGHYTLVVPAAATARRLVAFPTSSTLEPAAVSRNVPSDWHRSGRGADLVVISNPWFIPSLAPLVALHEREGMKVATVDVEQLYDEFSFGAQEPQAIRDFLERAAATWKPAPRFVLLVGDATYDPRNYLNLGQPDFLPARFVKTAYQRAPSDEWFVDFENDGFPKMAIGRLPVDTPEEASAMVNKLVAYESSSKLVSTGSAVLIADTNYGYNFSSATAMLSAHLPSTMNASVLVRDQSPSDAAFRADVMRGLWSGPDIVTYTGHGSVNRWGAGDFLRPQDARGLANTRASIYLMTTCLNSYVVDPKRESLGESLLKAKGGGIAALSSAALVNATSEITFGEQLLDAFFDAGPRTLGEDFASAVRQNTDPDVRRSATLLGDPAMRVG